MKWQKCEKGLKSDDNRLVIEFVYPAGSKQPDDLPELFLLYLDGVCISHGSNLIEVQALALATMKRREMLKC